MKINFPSIPGSICRFLVVAGMGIMGSFQAAGQQKQMMVRIADITIHPQHLGEYKQILAEEASASVKIEPGVIAIFPMYQQEDSSRVQILEIYADKAAYESHLKTPHFLKYKNATLHMVKSLKLVEMGTIDPASMPGIFAKFPSAGK